MTGLVESAEVLNRAYDLDCEYLGNSFAPEALVTKVASARRRVSGGSSNSGNDPSLDTQRAAGVAG